MIQRHSSHRCAWAGARPCLSAFAATWLVGSMLNVGCSQPKKAPPPDYSHLMQPAEHAMSIPSKQIVLPSYRLNTGDRLEIIYHVKHRVTEKGYELKMEDAIDVTFPFHPQYNQSVTVGSDGTIRLLLVGQIHVLGKEGNQRMDLTAGQLEDKLRELYAKYLKNPELTVTVRKANIKIDELKKAITTAPRGQSRLIPVSPDGTIDLPYIGSILAFGKTIPELRSDINQLYLENEFEEIDVTVQMHTWAPQKVFVYGEVANPGLISTDSPVSLIQALAACGGMTPRAQEDKVLLIRRKGLPIPQGTLVDVSQLLTAMQPSSGGEMPDFTQFRHDIWMQDMDIVYVPKTGLAVFDDWVDQVFTKGVRAILPYSFSTGINFGYELRDAPSSTTVKTRSGGPPNINIGVGP